jgi:diketogulonate reductase-like aldo/keto reductase
LAHGNEVLQHETLQQIAQRHDKSVSQIILRWHHQLGAVSIPKSASAARQIENLSIFDFALDEEEMKQINGLSRPDGRIRNQDPAVYEEF